MISSDLPITKSAEDKLNRAEFAKSLAKTISRYSFPSSFTIGLYGEWGSGKTSLLNMVLEAVEDKDEDAIIIRFNPWLCSDPKQLITQFFKQMAAAIKLKKPKAEKAWKLIDQYADIFDAANLIPGVGSIVAALGKILSKEASERVEQRTRDLQESKNQIVNRMTEENIKSIVSIDDIDRLSKEEIIAVFQLVKALADFPNTVYILAFDYSVVVRALGEVQHGNGKEYLEKVIQVPFEIPAPSFASVHEALFVKLDSILGDIPEDRWAKTTWAELFQFGLKKYIKSIRDVIRYTNVFLLKYELLKNETDPVDLLGLTALQVFEPSLYSKLPSSKDVLCGSEYSHSYEQQKVNEEKVKKISLLITNDETMTNAEAANSILGILFPRTRAATGIPFSIGRNYSHRDFIISNNIAAPECFDRYFALALENDAIPTNVIKHLVYEAAENELKEGIVQLYHEGKIIRLLEEIEAYANREPSVAIPCERALLIIKALTSKWSSFEVDDRSFFSIPFAWRLLFCVDPLLNAMDSASRFLCIRSVFEDADVQPSTLALLLRNFETQLGRFSEDASIRDNPIFSLKEVLELEGIFKNRAVEVIDSGIALKQYQGLDFLWILGQIDAELLANKKRSLISDDLSLTKIISYCTSRGTVVIKTVKKTRNVSRKGIGEFIDVDEAYRRIKKFIATSQFFSLPVDDQVNAMAFVLIMERKPTEATMEGSILEDTIIRALNQIQNNPTVE